jgi:hypothetical protein
MGRSNTTAVTAIGSKWAKQPASVFEYGRWLDAENTVVVLKESASLQAPGVGSIISRLSGLKP